MSQINVRSLSNENDDGAPDIVGISTLSSTAYFVPSKGSTAERPTGHVEQGSLRFNTDTQTLEYYRGETLGWNSFLLVDPELGGGTSTSNLNALGGRGIWAGGSEPVKSAIDFVTITTRGNSQDFGDLIRNKFGGAGGASRTRGVFQGGGTPTRLQEIDFIAIASTGDAADFGDCAEGDGSQGAGISNEIRALYCGRSSSQGVKNHIDFITIATTGSSEKGGELVGASETQMGIQSSTRGVVCGGSSNNTTMQFAAIMTEGDTQDFGDLIGSGATNLNGNGVSSNVRGIIAGGSGPIDTIQFITIASTGNATDFGNLTSARHQCGGNDNSIRGLWGGGATPTVLNTIEEITITTTGDAVDFGDLIAATRTHFAGVGNAHGGL